MLKESFSCSQNLWEQPFKLFLAFNNLLLLQAYICGVFKCVVSLGKMKSHLLSIFAISIVSHLVSIFEIKFSVYKQVNNQPTNQPTKQTPYREDKSLCSAAGATNNVTVTERGPPHINFASRNIPLYHSTVREVKDEN